MTITKTSIYSGKTRTRNLDVTLEEYDSWHLGGELIQNAMPRLDADDREFIKTGVTAEEWEEMFRVDLRREDFSGVAQRSL